MKNKETNNCKAVVNKKNSVKNMNDSWSKYFLSIKNKRFTPDVGCKT